MSITTRVNLHGSKYAIPIFGLGVFRASPGATTYQSVKWALAAGYGHIDTAKLYENEADVGKAIRESSVPREEIFVTTKLWVTDQGEESAYAAFHKSLERLGLDYVDLYLLHSPQPKDKRQGSWRALIKLQQEGKIRDIGVSNFGIHHLKEFFEAFPDHPPTVNQVEIHPWLNREELAVFCKEHNVIVEAYSPLAKARKAHDQTVLDIAAKHSKSWAQVLIRWSVQKGYVVIPKSEKQERIIANAEVFGWELDSEDMDKLNNMNEGFTTGWDPTTSD